MTESEIEHYNFDHFRNIASFQFFLLVFVSVEIDLYDLFIIFLQNQIIKTLG